MPHKRIRAVIIITTERQKVAHKTSFWRGLIWTRQRRRIGIAIIVEKEVSYVEREPRRKRPRNDEGAVEYEQRDWDTDSVCRL